MPIFVARIKIFQSMPQGHTGTGEEQLYSF